MQDGDIPKFSSNISVFIRICRTSLAQCDNVSNVFESLQDLSPGRKLPFKCFSPTENTVCPFKYIIKILIFGSFQQEPTQINPPVQYLCCMFVKLQCAVKVLWADCKHIVLNGVTQKSFSQLVATTFYKQCVSFILYSFIITVI